VLAVQPGRRFVGDEELAAVGAGPRVGHGKDPRAVVPEGGLDFVGEAVARPAGAVAQGVAALDHKVLLVAVGLGNDPVEGKAVVVGLAAADVHFTFGQGGEVGDGKGGFFVFQADEDFAPGGFNAGEKAVPQSGVARRGLGFDFAYGYFGGELFRTGKENDQQ